MAKIIKNIDTVDHTYNGQLIPAGESYTLQPLDELPMSNLDSLLSDIVNGKAQMNDGISDISNISDQINFLKGEFLEVVTQFEKRDKVVKLASAQAEVGSNGMATISIKIPGTPNSGAGRWIDGGTAWFDDQHKDDRILSVVFTDEDNLLGYGAGTVVGSYTDSELDSAQQGWRIPNKRGMIEVIAMGGYGFAPAGFYMKITGQKGGGIVTGTLYMNVMWGKVE
jgi:hypothetical protein